MQTESLKSFKLSNNNTLSTKTSKAFSRLCCKGALKPSELSLDKGLQEEVKPLGMLKMKREWNSREREWNSREDERNDFDKKLKTDEKLSEKFRAMDDMKNMFSPDSCATMNVYTSTKGLVNVRRQWVYYKTANGGTARSEFVGVHRIWGFGVIEPSAPINLLSVGQLKSVFDIEFESKNK